MLNDEEQSLIYQHAYVPEHLPDYVQSISGEEPFLHEFHICYFRRGHLTFIGYPLTQTNSEASDAYASACKRFRPGSCAIIAPRISQADYGEDAEQEDSYYRLDLPVPDLRPDVAYMVRRARRELRVQQGALGREHRKMVKTFLASHAFSREQKVVFKGIPRYLKNSPSARVLEARKGSDLVAFNILDLGSAGFGFYMFNFRSTKINVPGASDLLLHEMAALSQSEGKQALNLGLGVHPGVCRFKEKWGGVPFLPYTSLVVRRKTLDLDLLMKKL
jgi:hypothetical protein